MLVRLGSWIAVAGLLVSFMLAFAPAVVAVTPSVGDESITEGDSGIRLIQVAIIIDLEAGGSVAYSTRDGSATAADGDYEPRDGFAVCPSEGDPCDSRFVDITIYGDTNIEDDEEFFFDVVGVGTATITIINDDFPDETPPVLSLPDDLTVEATGPSGATVNYSATATDEDPSNPAVSCNPLSGTTFPLGTTTVDCSATDAAGNIANGSFDVTVQDRVAPALVLPADITTEATGPGGAAVPFLVSAADVVDSIPVVICDWTSGSVFPLGTTTVDCSATDYTGNFSNGSFDVTVVDTTAPALIVPDDIVLNADSPNGVVVTYSASASDIADQQPVVVCQPPSGSVFPVGSTQVTCTATDSSGNQANGSFLVMVAGVYDQMDDLMTSVWDTNLSFWSKYRLSITLARAKLALAFGQTSQACTQFSSFISQVQSATGSGLTPAQAGQLIADATRIRAVIGC